MKIAILLFSFLLSTPTWTKDNNCNLDKGQLRDAFTKFFKGDSALKARLRHHEKVLNDVREACKKIPTTLCNSSLKVEDKELLMNYIAQIKGPNTRQRLLEQIIPKSKDDSVHFQKLLGYLKTMEHKCAPPRYKACGSERAKTLFAEYFSRLSEHTPALTRMKDGESFYGSIPGLKGAVKESRETALEAQNNARYVNDLRKENPEGTTSIILNQASKKTINNVSKGVSDLIGNKGNELYFQRLNEGLVKAGMNPIENGVYLDYKEAAIVLGNHKLKNPQKFKEIAEQAARDADKDLRNYMENNFPETLYLMDDADRNASWIHTSVLSSDKNYDTELTEAVNAYRAREMRGAAAKLTPGEVIKSFINRGKNSIDNMAKLARDPELVSSGVLKANGNFNLASATIMRSLVSETPQLKLKELRNALKANFGSEVNLSNVSDKSLEAMIRLYDDMDALALPLRNSDVMGSFDETVGILGGDGIKAGAHDLIEKGEALAAHAQNIYSHNLSASEQVKAVQLALKEGDQNATKIIRSAPLIAREAMNALPESMRNRIGYDIILASGDDSVVVASSLNEVAKNPKEFKTIMLKIADNLSKAKQSFSTTLNGVEGTREVGSEVLRFFGGSNKKLAEEAEGMMKPVENMLGKADYLGTSWREQYPEVGMAIWKNEDGSHDVFINGDSVDQKFLDTLERVKSKMRKTDRMSFHIE